MALDLYAIRTALADQIKAALQGTGRDANVYAYPPDSPASPAVLIRPRGGTPTYVQYHQSFSMNEQGDGALAGIELEIEIRVGGSEVDAQIAMDDYLSTGTAASIVNAVEADKTLGGAVESCWIRAVGGPLRFVQDEAREWLAALLEFEAYERR